MAIISDYEEDQNVKTSSSSSCTSTKTSTFTATFNPQNPIRIVETVLDLVAKESDFLEKDTAEKEIFDVVKRAVEKKKRKKAEEEAKVKGENKRLKKEEKVNEEKTEEGEDKEESAKREMSFTQNEKCKGKHFTWSKPMSHMLLEILAEEALKGSKPSSTFKAESFVKVATEISQKFNVQCEPKHVENHLKTVKKEWGIITKLKNKSGFGWDDCLKMITVSKDVYDEEVKAHPNHDKYLNKKLDMYEIMTIVVGKDMATGNYAKSYADVNLEENTEEQSISIENEGEYEETSKGKGTSSSSTQKRQHRKRNRMYEDDGVEKLSKQIGDVAFAIQSLSKNQLDVNALYEEVMKVEGFDEITLGDAFDHLVQNEMLAKAFMAKNANLRKIWVQNFVTQHYYRPAC